MTIFMPFEPTITRGEKFPKRYTVAYLQGGSVDKAWLTVKTDPATVADASATIAKEISSTNVAGTGQVEDDGATSGVAVLRFDLTSTDTEALTAGLEYTYDLRVLMDTSANIFTIIKGPLIAEEYVTRDKT